MKMEYSTLELYAEKNWWLEINGLKKRSINKFVVQQGWRTMGITGLCATGTKK